jgi:hypothetical protein
VFSAYVLRHIAKHSGHEFNIVHTSSNLSFYTGVRHDDRGPRAAVTTIGGVRRQRQVRDCTHWCQPSGIVDSWTQVLQNALCNKPRDDATATAAGMND